jgi:hypothetical protein
LFAFSDEFEIGTTFEADLEKQTGGKLGAKNSSGTDTSVLFFLLYYMYVLPSLPNFLCIPK